MKTRSRTLIILSVLGVLLGSLAIGHALSLKPLADDAYAQTSAPAGQKYTVTGVIVKIDTNYYVQGQTPTKEIFNILNPNPALLDPYVKDGKAVKIDGSTVAGDNLKIESIAGKEYKEK